VKWHERYEVLGLGGTFGFFEMKFGIFEGMHEWYLEKRGGVKVTF
jgi:hypothetical protein